MAASRKFLRTWFGLDHTRRGADLDEPATSVEHGRLIASKPMLRRIYEDHYRFFIRESEGLPSGARLELGSGGGFLKEFIPEVVTSDVLPIPGVDRVVSALDLPFEAGALSALYLFDVLHHLPDVSRFLAEASRCLKPGGKVLMVEPANTLWGRFVFEHFHHEPFEPAATEWTLPQGGPLSMANGALPWIVLVRDRARFGSEFPELALARITFCHPFRYLISGGVSMRSLLPDWTYPGVAFMEDVLLRPFANQLGMFMRIVLTKRNHT